MDSIVTVDSDQRIVMFNTAAEKMFRCPAAEVIGKSLDHFIPSGFSPIHVKAIPKFGEADDTTRSIAAAGPVTGLRSDGDEFPLEASISQIEVGSRTLYTVIMRDITDRKRADEKVRESEQRYRSLFENMINGCAYCQMLFEDGQPQDFIFHDVNPYFEKLAGLTNVRGKRVTELIPGIKESSPDMFASYGRVALTGQPERFETYVTSLARWFSIAGYGAEPGYFVAVFDNITERKLSEATQNASELRYRRLFESAKDGILILDADTGRVVEANPYLMETLGYSYEKLLGKQLWEIGFFEDVSEAKKTFAELQDNGYVRYEDLPLKTHEGLTVEVEVVSNVYPVGDSKVIQCNVRDVSERKRSERALAETNRKLEATVEELSATTEQLWQASKLATMGELSASIAHELNNPLATVALRVENLLVHLTEDDQHRHPLEIIAQEVDRMAALVDNLLQFSRRNHRQITTVKVSQEISKSLDFVHCHLRTHQIEVVRDFADRLPTIQADRQELRQLFLNLLTNASDAMPQGGTLTVKAKPSVLDETEAVQIDFVDTGEGITAENLKKIWEPFFTTKMEGKGTGLGLGICRRIVEEHSGAIEIESTAGRGTTVRMLFPATAKGAPVDLE